MTQTILEALWLFLPAGVANMMPTIAARYNWLPALNHPLDGGRHLHGCRLLGDHKTWRGLVIGLLFGSITGFIQFILFRFNYFESISIFSYSHPVMSLLLGAWLALGALVGDAAASFFKRQLSISPGRSWYIVDQIDFILGALIFLVWLIPISFAHIFWAIIIFGLISFVSSFFGVKLKIKKSI